MFDALIGRTLKVASTAALLALFPTPMLADAALETAGFVQIRDSDFDQFWVDPDVDLTSYRQFTIQPVDLDFSTSWRRRIDRPASSPGRRVRQSDWNRVSADIRKEFDTAFPSTLVQKSSIEATDHQGPGVLELIPHLTEVRLRNPDIQTPMLSEVLVERAGEATFGLEFRDAQSGELVAWATDRRETRANRPFRRADRAFYRTQFRLLFKSWARISAESLSDDAKKGPRD